ncbi:restriction endonuclease subunit S [Collinsella sp. AGMB00827]|uniref:Restriction endonuclease subunit S n=1 Tax=Collinsella ureilytica TaxID=2869515 RepID=A0ABS7MJQ4_9ACTN|nr:restriction endonuclease subunit S [Collinsella urealyticum]MBY4797316.1 restriction endonuclease subunit S [Collinsella urealyticum]
MPKGWAWARVCSLVSKLGSGSTPRGGQRVYVASGIPFIRSQNVYNDGLRLEDVAYIDEATNKSKSGSIVCGMDLLLNITGGSIGRCAMVPSDFPGANVNQHVMIIRLIEPSLCRFVHAFVTSSFTQALILGKQLGSGRGGLSAETFSTFLIPVPPLAEQRRIVDALGKYLALVDGIERDRAELDVLLAQLKSKVLDLAVRSELTERDQKDEPASELLARIREEKLAMVGRGELKSKDVKNDTVIFTGSDGLRYEKPADGKGGAKCIEGEIPFEIPEGWSWCRLLTPVALDPKNDADDETPASFLPMAAIEEGFRNQYHPEVRRWKEIKKGFTQFADGDVVFAKISPCFENGKYFIASCLENGVGAGTTELYVLRSPSKGLYSKYLFYFLASNYFTGDAKKTFMGSVGQQRIKKDYLERMLLPVPPLGEQRRIVERIEEVFNLLD